VLASFIIRALTMEAASTSETPVNFYPTTWRNIQEDVFIFTAVKL
jgi:hypothetical protein